MPPPFEARYANVEISFTVPWDTRPRVLRHLAANLDDEHMKQLPGIGAFLKKLGTVSYLTKAAHYLLWRDDFTVFRHALEVTRDNYVAHVNLGRAYLDSGRHEAAAPHLHEVLRIVPGYPLAHNNLGVIALREGRLGEAERQFRAGIASFGGLAYLHRNLGIVLARTGRASEAREAFRKALAIDAEDDLALMHLGIALLREGDAACPMRRCAPKPGAWTAG